VVLAQVSLASMAAPVPAVMAPELEEERLAE
jgi:hypothetical protein